MKVPILILVILTFSLNLIAQSKSNDAIVNQLRQLQAAKLLTVAFDQPSNTSKIMGIADNFSSGEADDAGIQAMNFAIGFYYPGDSLTRSPDPILLTFWVLSKKPRFTVDHDLTIFGDQEIMTLGTARYVSKPRMDMEYLNFEISRESLTKIAGRTTVKFRLGDAEFSFTRSQLKLLADILIVSEVKN
ncbi:MAG TPA: hypothetical protein VGQ55_11090 [Pyrinomonadaceae bacterium]|jgi:hypothetical protein|nr:hypothetical protein [Pyrinomonadaceae bacterium]